MRTYLSRFLFFGLMALPLCFLSSEQPDEFITYEWLVEHVSDSSPADFLPHLRRLFNTTKVRGLLEFGCGYSTKYLLDHSEKVISTELITAATKKMNFRDRTLFSSRTNWLYLPYNKEGKDASFEQACTYQQTTHQDYSLIDKKYRKNLEKCIQITLQNAKVDGSPIDVAFVHPQVEMHGDLVQLLCSSSVPIVIAYPTATDSASHAKKGLYGWFKVKTEDTYEKISIPFGKGTTFWVRKDLPFIISSLKAYREAILLEKQKAPLSVPVMTEIADQMLLF